MFVWNSVITVFVFYQLCWDHNFCVSSQTLLIKKPCEIYLLSFPDFTLLTCFSKTFLPSSIEALQNSALKPGYFHLPIEIHERKIAEIISRRKNENKENNADACFLWRAQKRTTLKWCCAVVGRQKCVESLNKCTTFIFFSNND